MVGSNDKGNFKKWPPANKCKGRLRFQGLNVNEGEVLLSFSSGTSEAAIRIRTDSHLAIRYTNESVNFLDFSDFDLEDSRMWVSDSSVWLTQIVQTAAGVFDDIALLHFIFIFSDVTVEMICVNEPQLLV